MLIFNDLDILVNYDNATLLSVETIDCNIRNEFIWLNGCKPIEKLSFDNGAIKVVLLVENNTEYIGRLIKEMTSGKLQHTETHYNVVTLNNAEHKRITDNVYELTLEYSASFKLYEEVVLSDIRSVNLLYEGTVNTPVGLSLRAWGQNCSVDINGKVISFSNLTADDEIIIENGKILINGSNGFGKCNISEFPKLITGNNAISTYNCNGTLKYNPMYL